MTWFSKLFRQGNDPEATFVRTQRQPNGNTYDIYRAPTRSEAMAFLRGLEVKEERRYAIVETPQGNIGKDFILIFDEKSGDTIELGQRKALPQPKKSASRCCSCGYPVLPYGTIPDFGPAVGSITRVVLVSEAKKNGAGYSCGSCRAICCAFCATPEKSPRCPFCGNEMQPFDG